jgi:hypothetical protein
MRSDRTKQAMPDLFSTVSSEEPLAPKTKPVTEAKAEKARHVLPQDLPGAIRHLTDQELDLLIAASSAEAKRRSRSPPPTVQTNDVIPKRSSRSLDGQPGEPVVSLTRGQINAVRAAFKAGFKPSIIARQFKISPTDVRKVLASNTKSPTKA